MTIRTLLERMGIDLDGKTLTVDGRPVDLDVDDATSDMVRGRLEEARDSALRAAAGPDDRADCQRCDYPIDGYAGRWIHAPLPAGVDLRDAGPCPRAVPPPCDAMIGCTTCALPRGHVPSKHDGSPIPMPPRIAAVIAAGRDWAIAGHYTPRDQSERLDRLDYVELHLVFRATDTPDLVFVESETGDGRGVAAGTWSDYPDQPDLRRYTLPVAPHAVLKYR